MNNAMDDNSNNSQTRLSIGQQNSFYDKGKEPSNSVHGSNGMLSFNPASNLNQAPATEISVSPNNQNSITNPPAGSDIPMSFGGAMLANIGGDERNSISN
jgi:hypothetical protein